MALSTKIIAMAYRKPALLPDSRGHMSARILSLRMKGLAVVLVLLVFELIIFGCLYVQVEQAEKEARREGQLKEVVAHTEKLGRVLWESRRSLNGYLTNRDQTSWDNYTRLSGELPNTVDWLKAQPDFSEQQKILVLQIEKKVNQCLTWLITSKEKIDAMTPVESIEFINNPRNSMLMVYQTLISDIIALSKLNNQQLAAAPKEQQRLRESNRSIIFAGMAVNIIFAIALAIFFTRSITDRLKLMVQNTVRLKESKELLPPVGGRDEIASLDGAFHKMAADLAEAQRVKQAFVAMISHELRTPLTSVRGFLELLSMGAMGEVSKQIVDQTDRVHANVERLIKLINDLLDLEKMEAGKMQMAPELTSLGGAVERSLESVSAVCQNNKVQIKVLHVEFTVFADADRLEQVLVNLLSNAVKFSPACSEVTVEAESFDDCVEVRVKDRGRGVPSEHQVAIFERYQQVAADDAAKKGGTGLGLPVCKLIVEQLGGSIGVDSVQNEGSTFWFRLLKKEPN